MRKSQPDPADEEEEKVEGNEGKRKAKNRHEHRVGVLLF